MNTENVRSTPLKSFPVYASQWGKMGPGFTKKGLLSIASDGIELNVGGGTLFRADPNQIKVSMLVSSAWQIEAPDGRFMIRPGSNWLARGRLAWCSKEVRTTARQLLERLVSVGVTLPEPLMKLIG